MIHGYDVRAIRAAEQEAFGRTAEGELMQRAAHGLAESVLRQLGYVDACHVLVLAGPGNNGGDGLYAGGMLASRGVRVSMLATHPDKVHQPAWEACRDAGGEAVDLAGALALVGDRALVVDAVFGIGGHGGLSGDAATLALAAAESGAPVVAADVPSGLEADGPGTGEFHGVAPGDGAQAQGAEVSFVAGRTVAFGGAKICQFAEPSRSRCGTLEVVDIGLDFEAIGDAGQPALCQWQWSDVAAAWPVPRPTDDKYSRGVVGIDAGSETYPGAGVLSAYGAAYACPGMVRTLGSPAVAEAVVRALPSVVTAPGRVQAWVVGSGWGERPDGAERLAEVLSEDVPVLVDANALEFVDGLELRPDVLLTPHAGELARLLGVERSEVEADPIGHARRAADRFGATVLLKGATQYVARPGVATVDLAIPGPGWTAQAGSGDTLGGAIGTLLAAGLPAHEAAVCGASLQALTASASPPLPPHALARRFGSTIQSLTTPREARGGR